jgi:pSer/pThr/pTyr-binding forkhead associated (FHA) protein
MNTSPRLSIAEAGRPERSVALTGAATIGRAADNDIVLDEATVSRCHALLLADSQGVILLDLDSTNGTFVNGVPAPPDAQVHLKDGDVIAIGAVVARYQAPAAAQPADG